MIAEIFYHEGQDAAVSNIREALLAEFTPALKIVSTVITGSGGGYKEVETRHINATRYVKLVLAAVIDGTSMQVTNIVAYGFYIYSVCYGRQVNFQNRDIERLFPAVAMREEMMLVPENLAMTIGGAKFQHFEKGGVIPVAFDDSARLLGAAAEMRKTLCSRAVASMRNYASYRQGEQIDFDQLPVDFGFDSEFLKWALQREAREAIFYRELTCECEPSQLHIGRWTRVKITVQNNSELSINELSVQIRGPVMVLPSRIGTHIVAKGTTQIEVALKPEELGDFPIEILFARDSDRALETWLPSHHAWFSVIEPA